jgi:hypothetical protein
MDVGRHLKSGLPNGAPDDLADAFRCQYSILGIVLHPITRRQPPLAKASYPGAQAAARDAGQTHHDPAPCRSTRMGEEPRGMLWAAFFLLGPVFS